MINKENWFFVFFCIFFFSFFFILAQESIFSNADGMDLSISIPEKYKNVQAGDLLQFEIFIKSKERDGRYDVQLDYIMKKNDIVVNQRRELKAIETQASFLSSLSVPDELLPGIYSVEVILNEERSVMETFYVKSSEMTRIKAYFIVLIVAFLVIGGMIWWELRKLNKSKR